MVLHLNCRLQHTEVHRRRTNNGRVSAQTHRFLRLPPRRCTPVELTHTHTELESRLGTSKAHANHMKGQLSIVHTSILAGSMGASHGQLCSSAELPPRQLPATEFVGLHIMLTQNMHNNPNTSPPRQRLEDVVWPP